MSRSAQPILIASDTVFARLRNSGCMPPDLVARLWRDDMLDFVAAAASGRFSGAFDTDSFIGLDRSLVMKSGGDRDSVAQRFLSMLAGRLVVTIDVFGADHCELDDSPQSVAAAIGRYDELVVLLGEQGQPDQVAGTHWVLILVVCGELTVDDRTALKDLRARRNGPGVYLLDGRLRSDQQGKFVEAANIWAQMVPGLLVRLSVSAPAIGGKVLAWRSVSVEPSMPGAEIGRVFNAWLRAKVLGGGEAFVAPTFAVTPLKPKLKHCDTTPDLAFESAYESGKFHSSVDKHLAPADFATLRVAAAEQLRHAVIHAGQDADNDVRANESQTWGQAQGSPGHMTTMAKAINGERADYEEQLAKDSGPWKTLLQSLDAAEQSRQSALEVADVLDDARAHFVSWWARLGITVAAMLLVFYIVFVTLAPLLDAFFSSWDFWLPCGIGLAGAVLATIANWHFERHAGAVGVKNLLGKIETAQKNNASKACLKFIAESHERNQKFAYAQMLDHSGNLARRLQTTLEIVTRRTDVGQPVPETGLSAVAQLDRQVFRDGTVMAIGDLNAEAAKAEANAVLLSDGESLWLGLSRAWGVMGGQCDDENRGSYPVTVVQHVWSRALEHAWGDFHRAMVSNITAEWREHELNSIGKHGVRLSRMQGFSPSERPYLSSRHVHQQCQPNADVRMLFVRDAQLERALLEPLTRGGEQVIPLRSPKLPVLAMYFEEVPVRLTHEEGDA